MYSPEPKRKWSRVPRQTPPKIVPSHIGREGLVGNWLFYNGAGGKLYDFSGYGNHGDIIGPKWVDGPYGWALNFDGVDDYVNIPDDPSLDNPDTVTWLAWVYIDTLPFDTYRKVICRGDDTETMIIAGQQRGDTLYIQTRTGGTWGTSVNTGTLSAGTWYHIGLTWDNTTLRGYLNGSEYGSTTDAGLKSVSSVLRIGEDSYQLGVNPWDGKIDDVRIYDRVLSENEIKSHYEATKPLYVG